MRRYAVAVLCALLFVASPAAPLPEPGSTEDDAGSGTDAPDLAGPYPAPLVIAEGTFIGNLSWGTDSVLPETYGQVDPDPRDIYALDPPPNTVVRLHAEVIEGFDSQTEINVDLSGPRGFESRSIVYNPFNDRQRPVELVVTGIRSGPWHVAFHDFSQTPQRRTYQFTVEYATFEHGVDLDGEGDEIAAWEIRMRDGVSGRVEAYGTTGRPPPVAGDNMRLDRWFFNSPDRDCTFGALGWPLRGSNPAGAPSIGRNGVDGRSLVWTEGLPVDASAGSPVSVREDPLDIWKPWPQLSAETEDGNLSAWIGHADFRGVPWRGAVVWNGPAAGIVTPLNATADFHTLEDFDSVGDGYGAQVGPAAYAQDLTALTEVDNGSESFVFVNAFRRGFGDTPFGIHRPTITVTMPNGSTQAVHDDWFVWHPFDAEAWDGIYPDDHEHIGVPEGTWSFHLDRADGLEGDAVRVMRASFGFPLNECPS